MGSPSFFEGLHLHPFKGDFMQMSSVSYTLLLCPQRSNIPQTGDSVGLWGMLSFGAWKA